MPDEILLKVDAKQAAADLRSVVVSRGYDLESAISTTASLLCEVENKYVLGRLFTHFDKLLAEQLRLVSAEPLPVIE